MGINFILLFFMFVFLFNFCIFLFYNSQLFFPFSKKKYFKLFFISCSFYLEKKSNLISTCHQMKLYHVLKQHSLLVKSSRQFYSSFTTSLYRSPFTHYEIKTERLHVSPEILSWNLASSII